MKTKQTYMKSILLQELYVNPSIYHNFMYEQRESIANLLFQEGFYIISDELSKVISIIHKSDFDQFKKDEIILCDLIKNETRNKEKYESDKIEFYISVEEANREYQQCLDRYFECIVYEDSECFNGWISEAAHYLLSMY